MSFQSTLFRFFPPPKFLTPPRAGLAISENVVRVVRFEQKKNKPVLSYYGEEKLPEGTLKDGVIENESELRRVIKKFRKQYGLKFVTASVPERRAYIVKMTIPKVKETEIHEAIALHLEEYVPIQPQEAVFDYEILRVIGASCDKLELQVSIIQKEVVQNYVRAFKGTGVALASFEIEAQAVARAVTPKDNLNTFMVVDFGVHRTGIYIVTNGLVEFTTSVDISGGVLVDLFQEKFGAGREEVEKVKQGFNCTDHGIHEEDEHAAIFMSFVAAFRDEIGKRISYWKTHREVEDKTNNIEQIILTGSEANIKGLPEYLSGSLGMHVVFANVWQNIFDFDEYIPEIEKRDSFKYAAAVGLGVKALEPA